MQNDFFSTLIIADGTLPNVAATDDHNACVATLLADWDACHVSPEVDPMASSLSKLNEHAWRTAEAEVRILRAAVKQSEVGRKVYDEGLRELEARADDIQQCIDFAKAEADAGLRRASYTPITGITTETRNTTNAEAKANQFDFFVRVAPAVVEENRRLEAVQNKLERAKKRQAEFDAACDALLDVLRDFVSRQAIPIY